MIFATVGTQLPFDRLVRGLDQWASRNPQEEIFAQIGQANYIPENCEWARTISANTFRARLEECRIVVAHAGMGTIISAAEIGKPVIQLATTERLRHLGVLKIADDCDKLMQLLDESQGTVLSSHPTDSSEFDVSSKLITKIRSFAGLVAV
jgi:UDP-N-acetylglucosamine transferase subunit ALG13